MDIRNLSGIGAVLIVSAVLALPLRADIRFEGTETQLTTDLADQFDPAISGAYTVYTDRRSPDTDIYLYDIDAAVETQITSGGGDQMLNDVSGDLVVYTDYSSVIADIYLYKIDTAENIQLTDDPNSQPTSAIDGNRVVFDDNRNGHYDIYMIDVSTMIETRLTDDPSHQIWPAISGSVVVWEDYRNGNFDIFMLDLDSGIETQLTSDQAQERFPDIDGDIITFASDRNSTGDIYFYRISTGETFAVTSSEDYQTNPAVSGDYISYEDYSTGDADIWLYSISLDEIRQATTDTNDQYLHALSGNRLVYTDNRNENLDIYLFEFIFEEISDEPATVYVDSSATGSEDGRSWEDAYKYLQDALADPCLSQRDQIWVAAGTYTPDTNSAEPNGTGDRYATFQLINGVAIYGGFPSDGDPNFDDRDPNIYETILSGDLDANDVDVNDPCDLLTEPTRAENSYNVLVIFDASETVLLDGLVITAGNANSNGMLVRENGGGGIRIDNSMVDLSNCWLKANSGRLGGAMANYGSDVTLTDCKFTGNGAENGGGMFNTDDQSLTLIDCNFTGNSVSRFGGGILDSNSNDTVLIGCRLSNNSSGTSPNTGDTLGGGGGGMSSMYSNVSLTDCSFIVNTDDSEGFGPCGAGGLLNYGSDVTLTDCNFIGNSTPLIGGGMNNFENSGTTMVNCTFSGNSAYGGGGMSTLTDHTITIINCDFTGNTVLSFGGGILNSDSNEMVLIGCDISGNTAGTSIATGEDSIPGGGGGMSNMNSIVSLTDCSFFENTDDSVVGPACGGGGLYNYGSEVIVTDCDFIGNSTTSIGGGMRNWENSTAKVVNCIFVGNSALAGGGIGNMEEDSSSMINCAFSQNSAAEFGGGMLNTGNSDPNVTNCTFNGNSAADYGGGICSGNNSDTRLTNCILWENTANYGNEIALIFELTGSTAYINYCDVQGGQTSVLVQTGCILEWGTGNIDSDPCFVDSNGLDGIAGTEDDNLRLMPDSPCIDTGEPNYFDPNNLTDLDGRDRIVDGDCNDTEIIDMGAYEFSYVSFGDFAGDCDVDFEDFAVFALAWLTEDDDEQYNPICDISLPADSFIDEKDLKIFTSYWLAGTE